MYPLFLADLVMIIHFLFVVFVLLGGLVVLKHRWVAWIHLPCVFWAALIEFMNWICPLTPLEIYLLRKGGQAGYETSFLEYYLVPILYPSGLTREVQILLGLLVLIVNLPVYARLVREKRWLR